MKDDDYYYAQVNGEHYQRIVNTSGVRITECENRFEIVAQPDTEVWEQQAIQMLREWIRRRQEKLRESGCLSE
jgi:hypothetical protein